MRLTSVIVCVSISLMSHLGLAVNYQASGTIVPEKADKATIDWDLVLDDSNNVVSIESKFTNKSTGKIETIETTSWVNKEFSQYEFKRLNSKEHAVLQKVKDKYVMRYTKDGETKSTEFDGDENLMAGPMIMLEIYKYWDQLVKGEELKINFAAIDHQRSVGFNLRLKEKKEGFYTFEMEPGNFLIAMFVDTLYFKYRSRAEIPMVISGRVLPVNVNKGSIDPIDGAFITAKSNVDLSKIIQSKI